MLIFPKQIFEQRACWPRGRYPVSLRGNGQPRLGAWSASMCARLGDFFQGGLEMAKHVRFWLVSPFWKWQIPSKRELFEVIRYFYCKMISLILDMEILYPIRPCKYSQIWLSRSFWTTLYIDICLLSTWLCSSWIFFRYSNLNSCEPIWVLLMQCAPVKLQCAESKRGKFLKAPSAFLMRFSANSFLWLKVHILLNVFSFLNFFDWLTHIQSSSNFVQRKKLISRGHYIKLKKKIWEFNFEKKFFLTKLTLLIPKMQIFLV